MPHQILRDSGMDTAGGQKRSESMSERMEYGTIFTAWIEQFLLRELRPGDVVIMDNLNTHRVAEVLQLLQASGHQLLYLPQYSPDMNPIENMWAKMKSILRTIKARTLNELLSAVKIALAEITTTDCKGFFNHCGDRSIFI